MARAKKLKKEPGKVVAIIGDGAFTGGMVYEGMNNVSNLNNLIVVLNDNKMSISKNVGQMANYLTKLRTDPKYFRVKAHMETALGCIPAVGTALVEVLQEGKRSSAAASTTPQCSRKWGSSTLARWMATMLPS